MQERCFPNPPSFFRNASDIVNKCKSGVPRTRRLAIAFHLLSTEVYGCTHLHTQSCPPTSVYMGTHREGPPRAQTQPRAHRRGGAHAFEKGEPTPAERVDLRRPLSERRPPGVARTHCTRTGTCTHTRRVYGRTHPHTQSCPPTSVSMGTRREGPPRTHTGAWRSSINKSATRTNKSCYLKKLRTRLLENEHLQNFVLAHFGHRF